MLAVVHPTTPTSTSPAPPTATISGSSSSSSSASMMQRKATGSSSGTFRPVASSRTATGSGSVHFQHQIPPSRTPSYHVASSSSSGMPSNVGPAATSTPSNSRRAATPPPPPQTDPHSAPPSTEPPPFDISSYPPNDLLKLLASLLTQIAATNDSLSPSSSSSLHAIPSPQIHSPIWSTLTQASRTALSTPASTLTFHARNIPTISLESYFLRILKYCPTTNHVFLSLLVYFDRMAKLSLESTGRAFVIDSYNVHRLVIAGVTVASKFFSDVFYTNSRYAKVGGLPLPELNQLELQFLLLNDFRLVIRGDEMQRYAEQLILFSKSNGTGKEKELLREGGEGTVGSLHKPITMQRRDSQNAYSSFPSAAMGQTHSGSGGRSTSHSHPPLSSSTSSLPTRKRSTTPPASAPVAERRRSAEPQPTTSRRTPPIHVNARHRVASYSDEEDDDSDDDYDSDDYGSRRRRANDTETETETETDAGETTDGGSGSTTSDEPTVRPNAIGRRASTGGASTASSFDDDDDEDEDMAGGMEVDAGDAAREVIIADGEGEGTPEVRRGQHITPRGEGPEYLEGDVRMGSPRTRR